MSKDIAISIIVPAFNAAQWISETLQSVESQRWGGIELIVIDDGSTDATATIVSEQFPWVRLERQNNQGCSAARTRGTELATGTYIKYLDSDDLLIPDVLQRQLKLAASSDADVVYGNWQKLVQNGSGEWVEGDKVERRIEDVSDDYELAFFTTMWCTTGAYLWKRSFLQERHPGWHNDLPVIQDARFALDAAMSGATFIHDPQISALYRVHGNSSVSTRSRLAFNRDCFNNVREVYSLWTNRGTVNPKRRQAVLDLCENLGLWTFGLDRCLSLEILRYGATVAPGWRPRLSLARRMMSRVFGNFATAWVFMMMHRDSVITKDHILEG